MSRSPPRRETLPPSWSCALPDRSANRSRASRKAAPGSPPVDEGAKHAMCRATVEQCKRVRGVSGAFGGPASSTRPRSARSRLCLFREFGPCRKQHPRLIESAARLLGHVAAVVGLRAVRLREPVKVFGIGHCWPDRKGNRPRLPSGGGRTAGAFGGLLNQPSSDGEKANAAARNSFQRQFEVDHRRPAALPCPNRDQAGCWRPARARRPYVCCYCFACQCFTGWVPPPVGA